MPETIEDRVANFVLGEEKDIPEEPVVDLQTIEPEEEEEVKAEEAEEVESKEPEEKEPEVTYEELEIDGKVYEVPLELKEHFMFQKDYTQKTQTLAEDRKEIELTQQSLKTAADQYKFAQDIQPEINEVTQLDFQLKQWEQYLSDNARDMDAQQITLTQLEIRNAEKVRDEKIAGLKQKQAEFQQAQEQSAKELQAKSTEVLSKKIPDWGPDKQKSIDSFAVDSYGYTDEQLKMATHMDYQVLHDAMQFRAIQKGVKGAVKQVETAPTIRPKSRNPMPEDVKAKLNTRKKLKSSSLSEKQKAAVIQEEVARRLGM